MYYLKRYAVLYCVVNYEIASTSSQIYEQIEVIQDVVTPRKSKMNDTTRDKKQKNSGKKNLRKENGFNIAHYIAKAPIHRLCNSVIDSSVLISFHLSQNVYQAKK